MEVTQLPISSNVVVGFARVSCELTYGLGVWRFTSRKKVFMIWFGPDAMGKAISYGDVHLQMKKSGRRITFEHADVECVSALLNNVALSGTVVREKARFT